MKKNIELLADETLSQKLIKKWFWLYFFAYLSAPLGYLVRLFISNSPQVSVADFWVLYSIISLITFLYTYNDLWLTESLKFFLPRFYIKKEFNNIKTVIWLSLWIQILTWVLISAWLWFGWQWLALNYFQSEHAVVILKYFCLYFILTNIFQVIQTIFNAFQKTFEYQFMEFMRVTLIFVLVILCFFWGKWTIEWYSLAWVAWLWLAILVSIFLYSKYRPSLMQWKFHWDTVMLKKYSKYALRAFIWSGVWSLFWQIIQQMVLYFLLAENAWYYSNFLSLFFIWTTLIGPIMWLIFPIVSELVEKKDEHKLSLLYSFFYNYFSILILSFATLFIVLWPEISIALFWKQYLTSWILLQHAGIFLLFSLLASFNYSILAWMWKVRERVYITWIACVLTIIVTLIWIKFWGIYWAWIAFGLSNVFTWWLSLYLLKKQNFTLIVNWKFAIKNILLFIILWCIIYFWKIYLINVDWNRWYIIIRLIIIGLTFYGTICLLNLGIFEKLKKEIFNLKK